MRLEIKGPLLQTATLTSTRHCQTETQAHALLHLRWQQHRKRTAQRRTDCSYQLTTRADRQNPTTHCCKQPQTGIMTMRLEITGPMLLCATRVRMRVCVLHVRAEKFHSETSLASRPPIRTMNQRNSKKKRKRGSPRDRCQRLECPDHLLWLPIPAEKKWGTKLRCYECRCLHRHQAYRSQDLSHQIDFQLLVYA